MALRFPASNPRIFSDLTGGVVWVQTIQGNSELMVTSLVWGRSGGGAAGRLLSSSVDGSVSEWDLFHLQQKVVPFARSHYISIFFVKSNFRIVNLACMC